MESRNDLSLPSPVLNQGGRRRSSRHPELPKWQDGENRARLLYLVVSGGKIGKRHWNGHGFLGEVLKRHLQLLSRFQGGQQLGLDRRSVVETPDLPGLDMHDERVTIIYLSLDACLPVLTDKNLH